MTLFARATGTRTARCSEKGVAERLQPSTSSSPRPIARHQRSTRREGWQWGRFASRVARAHSRGHERDRDEEGRDADKRNEVGPGRLLSMDGRTGVAISETMSPTAKPRMVSSIACLRISARTFVECAPSVRLSCHMLAERCAVHICLRARPSNRQQRSDHIRSHRPLSFDHPQPSNRRGDQDVSPA